MREGTWLAAICLTALAFASIASAQLAGTLVLRSGEHVSGTLMDMGADFTMRVNGQDRHYAINDVVLIDFVGGGSGLPNTELSAVPPSGHLIVMRGGNNFTGQLIDISGNPMQLVFSTAQGERRIPASEIGRVYLSRPGGTAAGTTGAQTGGQKTVVLGGNVMWVDTGIQVTRGQTLNFASSGEIRLSGNPDDKAGPAGSVLGRTESRAPLGSALTGALIGRVGIGRPFGIGDQTSIVTPATGRLFLGINDSNVRDNSGSFTVTIGY